MISIELIRKSAQNDVQLAKLFERVREYAQLYFIAKQRQKGCDGMGEVATLKDELIYLTNEMIRYCKEKGYLLGDVSDDIDSIAHDLCKMQPE